MLSEISQPPPSHARTTEGLPKSDGREEADPDVQDNLHDIVKSAGEYRHVLIEKKTFEIGELEQEVLPSIHSHERQRVLHTSEEDCHDVSLERDSEDTPRDECPSDVLHVRPEASLEMENPGPHQSPSSPQPITPPALPLHLIPLLPQVSTSPKRQRRSLGPSFNQADTVTDDFMGGGDNATGGTIPSPHNLRSHIQNPSTEPAGISRTLAYAMDQMNATPSRGAEREELAMVKEAEEDCGGDEATRPTTVRFEDSTSQSAELAERLWTDAVQAAATSRMHEESEQRMKRAAQSSSEDEGVSLRQDDTTDARKMRSGKGVMPVAEGGLRYCLYGLGLQNKHATSEMDANAWCTTEGGSRSVDPEVEASGSGSETEGATLASQTQTVKPAQPQEYTRLKEREVELRRAEAEARILEERLEAREKDLRIRLATVRQRLEAVRQRKASINYREEIIRQKLEAITKESQESANGLVDTAPESS